MTHIQFLREYFQARTDQIKAEIERRSPFRQKYFAADCLYDSRRGIVESSQAENILDVSEVDGEVLVNTTGTSANKMAFPLRYHLRRNGESWLIHQIEFRCSACNGTGKSPYAESGTACQFCDGKGWR